MWRSNSPSLAEAEMSGSPAFSVRRRWRWNVPMRVGLAFLGTTSLTLFLSILADGQSSPASGISASIFWMLAVTGGCLCGVLCIGSLRTLSTIESELADAARLSGPVAGGANVSSTPPTVWARGLIGGEPAAVGYNRLVEAALQNRSSTGNREPAALDQSVITLARGMRALPAAWIITNPDGAIHSISPRASALLRLREPPVQGIGDILQLDHAATAKGLIGGQSMRQRLLGPVRMVQCRHQLAWDTPAQEAGMDIEIEITRCRLDGRGGDGEGMVWLIDDITAQQNAVRSRDDFLMMATHELRTPLTNLRGYAEALRDESDVDLEQQKAFCNVIVSESIRLGRLVDQLLSMGQIEAGSMVLDARELNLHSLLDAVDHQVRGQAEQKGIELRVQVSPKLPTVFGDRDKLQAALINLMGNAVKYTPEGGHVTMLCQSVQGDGGGTEPADSGCIWIEVIDDGPGIQVDDQAKVFEKFYRCESTSAAHQGSGLGLALAREVARLHDGDIELTSVPGQGCRFMMKLPARGEAQSGLSHR